MNPTVQTQYDQLKTLINETEADVAKADEGQAAAGTRLRKNLQQIKTLSQEMRNNVMTVQKSKKGGTPE